MKKGIIVACIVLAAMIAALFLFGGCKSNPTSVPDSILQLKIKDRVSRWDFPDDPQIVITHSYDKDAHTDTVTVEYSLAYTYGTYEASIEDMVFQYDKASDNWDMIDWGDEHELSVSWNEKKLDELCGSYSGTDYSSSGRHTYEWSILINRIDVKNEKVYLSGEGSFEVSWWFDDWEQRPFKEVSGFGMYSGVLQCDDNGRPALCFDAQEEGDIHLGGDYHFMITPENGPYFRCYDNYSWRLLKH